MLIHSMRNIIFSACGVVEWYSTNMNNCSELIFDQNFFLHLHYLYYIKYKHLRVLMINGVQ